MRHLITSTKRPKKCVHGICFYVLSGFTLFLAGLERLPDDPRLQRGALLRHAHHRNVSRIPPVRRHTSGYYYTLL